jgi:hypothetical protein
MSAFGPCAHPGCRSGNTMGDYCIRHWYEQRGKTLPPAAEPTYRPRVTVPALDRQTTVAGRHHNSHEAARRALGRSGTQRVKIYELVKAHPEGLTADDVQRLTGFPVNSVNPRVNELVNDGYLVDTGRRRETRYGVPATVWEVATW